MEINWPVEFHSADSVDAKVEKLYDVIFRLLDRHEKTKHVKRHPCWFSRVTNHLLGKKRIYHQKWKQHLCLIPKSARFCKIQGVPNEDKRKHCE